MLSIQQMLQTHPRPIPSESQAQVTSCIEACFECVATCTACANACLFEPHVNELLTCIRLNNDCADVCSATGRIIARQAGYDADLVKSQLQACITACTVCARECGQHAAMHDHCRVCADACRQCAAACDQMLDIIPA